MPIRFAGCSDTLALVDARDAHRAKNGLGPVKRIIAPSMLTQTRLSKDLIAALKPTTFCFEQGINLRAEYANVSAEGARLKRGPALHDVEALRAESISVPVSELDRPLSVLPFSTGAVEVGGEEEGVMSNING